MCVLYVYMLYIYKYIHIYTATRHMAVNRPRQKRMSKQCKAKLQQRYTHEALKPKHSNAKPSSANTAQKITLHKERDPIT